MKSERPSQKKINSGTKKEIEISKLERKIKRKLGNHFKTLGYEMDKKGTLSTVHKEKSGIRILHSEHRKDKLIAENSFIQKNKDKMLPFFASGEEVTPSMITPRLELVKTSSWEADLFRFASLTWSVPVSNGYGRRLRFLVWDDSNGKLIGLIALGDPVFNLKVRDNRIGWSSSQRLINLVNILDAYVLGALPPYNMLLGGKLLACLISSKEIKKVFAEKYGNSRGIISGKKKNASLVAVTTSSSLGRSSVYNRLKLNNKNYFESLGYTQGWGHFHVPVDLFEDMRKLLELKKHKYVDNHSFGGGPNWRMRAIRAAFSLIGLKQDILKHGISREVLFCKLAVNAEDYLSGKSDSINYKGLQTVKEISSIALERWIIPRAVRMPEYKLWNKAQIMDLLSPDLSVFPSQLKTDVSSLGHKTKCSIVKTSPLQPTANF